MDIEYSEFLECRIDFCMKENTSNIEKIKTLAKYKKNYTELLENNYLHSAEVSNLKKQLQRIDAYINNLKKEKSPENISGDFF